LSPNTPPRAFASSFASSHEKLPKTTEYSDEFCAKINEGVKTARNIIFLRLFMFIKRNVIFVIRDKKHPTPSVS
tara:strand:- start:1089 stop:1310 length:222 start_codon:yes stop_codon:yes gene_type:complete